MTVRARWIVVGLVKRIRYRVVGNHGYLCDGFWMNWRGRKDWCQPVEFDDWVELEWAVTRCCELRGLQPEAVVVDCAGEYRAVRVLVRRRPGGKLLLNQN